MVHVVELVDDFLVEQDTLHNIVAHRLFQRTHTPWLKSERENVLTHPHCTCVTCHLECCCAVSFPHCHKCSCVVTGQNILVQSVLLWEHDPSYLQYTLRN